MNLVLRTLNSVPESVDWRAGCFFEGRCSDRLASLLAGRLLHRGGAAMNKVHHQARGKHSGAVNRLCSPEGAPYISTQTLADVRLSHLNGCWTNRSLWQNRKSPALLALLFHLFICLFVAYLKTIYVPLDRLCGLVVRVSGYRYRGPGFDPRRYQIFWVVVGLERGPHSLVSLVRSIEELLEWKK